MGEIKTNDLEEIKSPTVENYMDIKPLEGTTPKEARSNWDNEFNRIGDRQRAFETSKEKEQLDDNGKVYGR